MRRRARGIWIGALLASLAVVAACGSKETSTPHEAAAQPLPPEWEELLPNARLAQQEVLTGGQPTPEQLERARDLGFRTVINLRQPDERGSEDPESVKRLGMTYLALPIDGATGLTADNARQLADALDAAERPVMLHCGSGNRVGGLLAVAAFHLEEASIDEALAYGRATGLTRLEPKVRERLERAER